MTRLADVHPAGHPQCVERRTLPPNGDIGLIGLRDACLALWDRTGAVFPRLGDDVGPFERWRNTRSVGALIDLVAERARSYPEGDRARAVWRDELRERVLHVGQACLGWSPAYGRLLSGDAFHDTAASFAREARRFDATISLEALGQALRNVWVGNSLQLLIGVPVQLTPALFAYSMLYPTTDNVLDDPHLPAAAKRTFNDRLAARLAGAGSPPQDAREEKPWALVTILEREFPRGSHPGIWAAVLGIHRAQVESLRQQQDRRVSDADLLGLTVAKGGASVLADLYLVAPAVEPRMQTFAFRYGVFLQMLDDLQDVAPDLAAGHETLFTRAARRGPLDELAARLAAFIDVVVDGCEGAAHPAHAAAVELIRQNCRALIVGVMAREPERFSRRLRRQVASQWPVGLRGMRRLIRRGHRQFVRTRAELRRTRGVDSPLAFLLSAAPPRAC